MPESTSAASRLGPVGVLSREDLEGEAGVTSESSVGLSQIDAAGEAPEELADPVVLVLFSHDGFGLADRGHRGR